MLRRLIVLFSLQGQPMCTSFVYRKEKVIVGMNFDNDGKDFKISSSVNGDDFLVSVSINRKFFPTLGVNRNGVFVNDLMVDSNGAGKYKRQNDKRWVTTTLLNYVMGAEITFDDVKQLLQSKEIVNAPNASTHQMIVDRNGGTCVVEPGRKTIFAESKDSDWCVMTNFAQPEDGQVIPNLVSGSGVDRYCRVVQLLDRLQMPLDVQGAFAILKSVKQEGPDWWTG